MTSRKAPELSWTFMTIVMASVVSLLGLLIALALRRTGAWPKWDYSEVVFGALCGAAVVDRLHPGHPAAVIAVFVPVMSAVLLLARVIFHLYVLGEPIEL